MKKQNSIDMIEIVAEGLKPLKEKIVFVGGTTVSFYLQPDSLDEVRPTDDVDCVVEITTHKDFYSLLATLEKIGFKHSMERSAPICRMNYCGLKVDIMPSEMRILGFSNIWHREGMQNAVETKLPNGEKIKIFSLPYFVAAKVEAFFGRGKGDFRLSSDIEDIVTVLSGQQNFKLLTDSPDNVRQYLKKNFRDFLGNSSFLESLTAHLQPGPKQEQNIEKLLDAINRFCIEVTS